MHVSDSGRQKHAQLKLYPFSKLLPVVLKGKIRIRSVLYTRCWFAVYCTFIVSVLHIRYLFKLCAFNLKYFYVCCIFNRVTDLDTNCVSETRFFGCKNFHVLFNDRSIFCHWASLVCYTYAFTSLTGPFFAQINYNILDLDKTSLGALYWLVDSFHRHETFVRAAFQAKPSLMSAMQLTTTSLRSGTNNGSEDKLVCLTICVQHFVLWLIKWNLSWIAKAIIQRHDSSLCCYLFGTKISLHSFVWPLNIFYSKSVIIRFNLSIFMPLLMKYCVYIFFRLFLCNRNNI
jgi:hypothetical protein